MAIIGILIIADEQTSVFESISYPIIAITYWMLDILSQI